MQWLGWIFHCDRNKCTNQKATSTDAPVGALIEAVRDGWMPGPHRSGSRERIFCPEHVADAKVGSAADGKPHQSGPQARSFP